MKESAPSDKRTKQYKAWAAKHKAASNGLGDQIEKVTKATGIKKAVDAVFDAMGKDCGCDKRKEKLNEAFPSNKPECFNEEEFNLIKTAVERNKNTFNFTADETKAYTAIYNRVFDKEVRCIPCSFKNTIWKQLVKLYNLYK